MDSIPFAVDLILAVFFVIMIIDGRRKGFVRMALSLVAVFVGFLIAKEYSEPVAEWVFESFFRNGITEKLTAAIAGSAGNGANAVLVAVPSFITPIMETLGLSVETILSEAAGSIDAAQTAEAIVDTAIKPAAVSVLYGTVFIVVFYIIRLISRLLIEVVDKGFKLPVLNTANNLLGSVVGAIKGVLVVIVLCVIATGAAAFAPETVFSRAVADSIIVKLVCDDAGLFSIFQFLN